MKLEFDILSNDIETELAHEDKTKPFLVFLTVSILFLLIQPFSSDVGMLEIPIFVAVCFGTLFFLKKTYLVKNEPEMIKEKIVDKLMVTNEPFEMVNLAGERIMDTKFEGTVTAKYEGYYQEVESFSRHHNIYYGTSNLLIINGYQTKRKFFIFLGSSGDKQKFFKLIDLLRDSNIDVLEFTRGERTYTGKKLGYKEIQEFKKGRNSRPG